MSIKWKRKDRFWQGLIVPAAIFLCLIVFLSVSVGKISASSDKENAQVLENAVKRAMVQCYALEGMYPPNVEYLEENYGLVVDHDKYVVHYEAFAANILPDVKAVNISVR